MADGNAVNPVQVQKYLSGVDYPAQKDALVERAKQEGASEDVIRTLQSLPDQRYDSPADVSEQIGKLT